MGWRFVYNKIKEVLEDEEFKKENKKWNPSTPEDAIVVALWHLHHEYLQNASDWHKKNYGMSFLKKRLKNEV
ncbi:MAG: hypothetical protein ACE5K4_10955 [Candidatus Hydrothermarchaeota archaeon]